MNTRIVKIQTLKDFNYSKNCKSTLAKTGEILEIELTDFLLNLFVKQGKFIILDSNVISTSETSSEVQQKVKINQDAVTITTNQTDERHIEVVLNLDMNKAMEQVIDNVKIEEQVQDYSNLSIEEIKKILKEKNISFGGNSSKETLLKKLK